MHKNEFIKQLAKDTNLPQKEVNLIIKSAIDLISQTLRNGDKVVLTGFGTFEVRQRRARRGVNPQTKERITIPETQTPGFTASNSLKLNVLGETTPDSKPSRSRAKVTANKSDKAAVKTVRAKTATGNSTRASR